MGTPLTHEYLERISSRMSTGELMKHVRNGTVKPTQESVNAYLTDNRAERKGQQNMAKKAARKSARKGARKGTRKTARKTRKTTRKTARKGGRKKARRSVARPSAEETTELVGGSVLTITRRGSRWQWSFKGRKGLATSRALARAVALDTQRSNPRKARTTRKSLTARKGRKTTRKTSRKTSKKGGRLYTQSEVAALVKQTADVCARKLGKLARKGKRRGKRVVSAQRLKKGQFSVKTLKVSDAQLGLKGPAAVKNLSAKTLKIGKGRRTKVLKTWTCQGYTRTGCGGGKRGGHVLNRVRARK